MIWVLKWFIYLCIFTSMEVIIYGFIRIFNKSIPWEERKSMYMITYLPMLIIYSILPLSFELFINALPLTDWWCLLFIPIDFLYGFIVSTLLESLIGFILVKSVGICPWGVYTREQGGIWFLGGTSKWSWSAGYGALAILFHLFLLTFNSFLGV